MKHLPLLVIFNVINLFSFGQVNYEDDSFFDNSFDRKVVRENRIDTIEETIFYPEKELSKFFAFDTLGNLLHMITYDWTTRKNIKESILNYDNDGRLITKRDNEEGFENNTSYFYNMDGQLERSVKTKNNKAFFTIIYTYQDKRLIKETKRDEAGMQVTKYQYNDSNQLVFSNTKIATGQFEIYNSISYDIKGNKSMEIITFFSTDTVIYKYDDSNRLTLEQRGKNLDKYSYNEKGLLYEKAVTRIMPGNSVTTYCLRYRYALSK